MDESLTNSDPRTQLPKLCNFEMLNGMIGSHVRLVGRVLSNEGGNLVLESPDGAKVLCVIKQPAAHDLSQVVEITGVVMSSPQSRGASIHLEQYGTIHNWDDHVNLEHLNDAIRYTNQQRIAKYLKFPGDAGVTSHPSI
ncbi:hypothetical protein X943_002473 [Babesia divergens]|uniref:Replication factor A protein 3 n=1 Tax=Babesia divergens TaxID=32595 RepID=A0AAD9GFH1_BABDI|nr:hypothetical protein X943_002473 [Babesia divergens]